jgi:4-amino-4-deoxy-L-arabinose transferase-like glycosyltransferase/membrane-associated phospholipid phosphatase
MLQDLNIRLFSIVNGLSSPALDPLFYMITLIGSGFVLIPVVIIAYFTNREKITSVVFSFLISGAAVQVIKYLWSVPRPAALLENVHVVGEVLYAGSFPSGHTATAMALFYVLSNGQRLAVKITLLAIAIAIGYSRIYVGAHFPADVVAGALVGVLAGFIAVRYDSFFIKYKKEILIAALPAALLFYRLGDFPFFIVDEARNAEAAREMLQSGDFIVPTFNYELRTDKPPLHYWFFILFYKIFGVSEFASRFISPILGLVLIYLVYKFTSMLIDKAAAVGASLILGTSLYFFLLFRMAVPDPFLVLFSTAALLFFYKGVMSKNKKYIALFYLFMGLSALAKGPVGFIIPFAIAATFVFLNKQSVNIAGRVKALKVFVSMPHIAGYIIFAAIAVPWYVAVSLKTGGNFASGFFIHHNIERFTSHVAGPNAPFAATFLYLIVGFFPWSYLLIQTLAGAIKERKDPFTLFLLIWAAVYLIVYTVSATRLPHYLVPAYPALAILTAKYFKSYIKSQRISSVGIASTGLILCLFASTAGNASADVLLRYLAYFFSDNKIMMFSDTVVKVLKTLMIGIALASIPLIAIGIAAFIKKIDMLFAVAICFSCSLLVGTGLILPLSNDFFIPKKIANVVHNYENSENVKVASIYSYKYYDPAFEFYTRKKIIRTEDLSTLPDSAILASAGEFMPDKLPFKYANLAEIKDILRKKDVRIVKIIKNHESREKK